jgi:hypothetical protein
MTPSEHILSFCAKLGLEREDVINAETPFDYKLTSDLPGSDVAVVEPKDYQELIRIFADAVSLTIGRPDVAPLLEIRNGQIGDLYGAVSNLRRLGTKVQLQVDLKIDKAILLAQHGLDASGVFGLLFLFGENLVRLLRAPLRTLDKNLFLDEHTPTFVVVLDASIRCCGPLLTITGLDSLEELRERLSAPTGKLLNRLERYREARANSLNWIDVDLHRLTPLHLMLDSCTGTVDDIEPLLRFQVLRLCVLYTANRCVRNGDDFLAYFANSERSATVALQSVSSDPPDRNLLAKFAIWPYAGQEADRVEFLQNAFARELDKEGGEENLNTLIKELGRLLDEARWHYRVFVDAEIDKHFERVRDFSKYIGEVHKEVSASLNAVTKNLVDTLLATVGIVVLTLLAALVDNKTQGSIFTVAMRGYAVYLVLFQVVYRLGSIWHSYQLENLQLAEYNAEYSRLLTKRQFEAAIRPLERRKRQFVKWFWGTVGIYLVVAAAIWVLAGSLPPRLVQAGVWSTPTATPTIAPMQITPAVAPSITP